MNSSAPFVSNLVIFVCQNAWLDFTSIVFNFKLSLSIIVKKKEQQRPFRLGSCHCCVSKCLTWFYSNFFFQLSLSIIVKKKGTAAPLSSLISSSLLCVGGWVLDRTVTIRQRTWGHFLTIKLGNKVGCMTEHQIWLVDGYNWQGHGASCDSIVLSNQIQTFQCSYKSGGGEGDEQTFYLSRIQALFGVKFPGLKLQKWWWRGWWGTRSLTCCTMRNSKRLSMSLIRWR